MRDLSRGGGRSLTDKLAALLDRQLDKDHYDLVYVLLHPGREPVRVALRKRC